MVGRQLTIFSIIVPFWLIAAQSGWRGMIAVWPACLVSGLSFAIAQFVMSNFHGPWLVNIVAAIVSMLSLVALMRFWKTVDAVEKAGAPDAATTKPKGPCMESLAAVGVPFGVRVSVGMCRSSPRRSTPAFAPGKYEVPLLHLAVIKTPPVAPAPTPEDAIFKLNAFSATGTALLLAGILSGFALGLGPMKLLTIYWRTFLRIRISLLTIALMLALGNVTRFSGTDTTMGLAMAGTGWLFPFFSPIIGWLGVALTGSDTSSNVLFGNLQKVSAKALGLSPILMAASNSSGGVMGKMIDAQSIVVASVATGGHPDSPDAGTVLRAVFWHSLALAILVGILVMLQTYVFPWMVPS